MKGLKSYFQFLGIAIIFFLSLIVFNPSNVFADKCVGTPSACGSLIASCATCGCSYAAGSCANGGGGSCGGCGTSGACSSCVVAGCSWDAAGPCSNNGTCGGCGTSGACTSCSAASCSWDPAGPCSNNGSCGSIGSETPCKACSGCSWSSACPSIYSFNKEGDKVLEEETLLGLINKRMEKYHYEDLEYAHPQNKELKIVIQEDVLEVGYFNDIKLDVIDTSAKQVFIAPDGSPQTVNNLQEVISCKSKRGEDCLKQILKQDSKFDETLLFSLGGGICFMDNWRETAWATQDILSLDFSKKENLRDWIEIELPPAPSGAKTAKLIVSGSDTGILSFAEVEWVNTSKENVKLFFDLSDNTFFGDHWAKQVYRVVSPKIQIQNEKGEWINYPDSSFDENILSTYDTVVFPLDVSLIKNNRVRIESMAYTYVYDFVGVDYSESEFIRHTISPSSAIFNGEDVVGKLNKLDDERLILTIGEQVELTFQLPEEEELLNRSYHIQIAGYYQPSRRLGEEEASFYKSTLSQIKEEGLFGFIKKTGFEIYDMIMTSTNFDYGNRRFLIKYVEKLEKMGIDPDSAFPLDFFCNSPEEEISSDESFFKDILNIIILFAILAILIVLNKKKRSRLLEILIIIFILIILMFLINSIIVRADCSGTLNCTGYSSQTACTACSQCYWDPEGPCGGTLNCGAIVDSGICSGCSQCYWDPEGPCGGTLSCGGLSEGNCTGCTQCSWTAASCSGTASVCSTHGTQSPCESCGCTWNESPTVASAVLNGGNAIELTPNDIKTITAVASTTDLDGYADIATIIGKLFRSAVSGAESCSLNDNNCYEDASCATSSCSGNSCHVTCSFDVWFHADPTDTGDFSGQTWKGYVWATDKQSQSNGTSSSGVELNTLRALAVTDTISYGYVSAGNNTGSTNQTTTVTNVGNVAIDVDLYGYNMCTDYPTCSGGIIGVGNQEYFVSAFTWGNGTDLQTSSSTINLDLSKPTSHPSTSTDDVYWGMGVPLNSPSGAYKGENIFIQTAAQ